MVWSVCPACWLLFWERLVHWCMRSSDTTSHSTLRNDMCFVLVKCGRKITHVSFIDVNLLRQTWIVQHISQLNGVSMKFPLICVCGTLSQAPYCQSVACTVSLLPILSCYLDISPNGQLEQVHPFLNHPKVIMMVINQHTNVSIHLIWYYVMSSCAWIFDDYHPDLN